MGLFTTSPRLDSMENLLLDQLQDLYDAEQRLTRALPQMMNAASDPALKGLFQAHLGETQNQVARLERIFGLLGQSAKSKTCEAMKGLLKESDEVVGASGTPDVKDAALIAAAQRVEHYEIAGYGCARTFAQCVGNSDAARLLQETLDEEANADKKLTALAEQHVNAHATT